MVVTSVMLSRKNIVCLQNEVAAELTIDRIIVSTRIKAICL